MKEVALADHVPLWVTIRGEGVTALVTPSADYIGALELGTLDTRFAAEPEQEGIGEALRSFMGGVDEGTTLHFVYRVERRMEAVIEQYRSLCSQADSANLREYVSGRAEWLGKREGRHTRVYLFFSQGGTGAVAGTQRGFLGFQPIRFSRASAVTPEKHSAKLKELGHLRDRLMNQLRAVGIDGRELEVEEVQRIHWEMLNPVRARAGHRPTPVRLRDNLWSEGTIRREGDWLREYTEAEELAHEDMEDGRGHFTQERLFRRVLTLKSLPEDGTSYFSAQPLLDLSMSDGVDSRGFPFWLTVTVQIRSQFWARARLNWQHRFVELSRGIAEKLRDTNLDQEEADAAQEGSLRGLFAELHAMSSRVAAISVSVLLEGETLEALEAQTEAARTAFGRCGNSEFLVEDVTQIAAFLSMLPGGGPYQLRRKGCTSRNAADLLPLFSPWQGCERPYSLAQTPAGDIVRLDFFDKRLSAAHHGIVVADTGSGKSMGFALFVIDGLGAGIEGVLVDNGGSWRLLTEVFGGTHIEVDLKTSISPFQEYSAIHDPGSGGVDNEELESMVLFLEVCLHDRDLPSLSKLQTDVLSRAIAWWYETRMRNEPERRPLIGEFREALSLYEWKHPDDRSIAEEFVRRLRIYCDGMYAPFLNRPSPLRFDSSLVTLDLQHVSQREGTKQIAMAVIMQMVANRARHRRRRTIVAVDELHEYLKGDEVAPRFIAASYRKLRKANAAMWTLTQHFADIARSEVGHAITGNAAIDIFLFHKSGHQLVEEYFEFTPGMREAFRKLETRPGHYSDLLLSYGKHVAVLRHRAHPLAYWLLTTDPEDKPVRERALEQNAHVPVLEVLRKLAARYPHGVVGGPRAVAA